MKIRSPLILFVVIIVLSGVALVTLRLSRPSAYVELVVKGNAIGAVSGTLRIKEAHRMRVRSELGGKVEATNMEIGQVINKGDLLLQLDTDDIDLAIESINIDKEAHEKHLALGSSLKFAIKAKEGVLKTQNKLHEKGSVSLTKLKTTQRQLDELYERRERQKIDNDKLLKKLETSIETKNRQLQKMSVMSPINGTIVHVYSHEGDLIGPGSVIAEVLATERRVEASISEEDFSKVEAGQHVIARLLGYGNEILEGRVTQLLPTSDPTSQRYSIFLDLNLEPERLTPGLTGEVSIIIGEREDALVIPHRALLDNSVFVVNEGVVELRSVKIGYESLNLVEILEGLEEGESVIVEELDRFREGSKVRL
ncbi:MAG: Macrolide export protein MacA [Candidatus Moanabacter tarae]|uniref:Macrolide export protein MacA n=1 Tax=Candidatus Moanibacter tarae TaxID=2200854 RepID=A0A2Z4ANM7_9BACT|nr:MAG: Macrolide export protein MacA [Candidatus Moanabacter tarae]|tara:strand:- start:107604 stop:108704 length:1101 start_codon:yes stop_codon:yes gene_type:complete